MKIMLFLFGQPSLSALKQRYELWSINTHFNDGNSLLSKIIISYYQDTMNITYPFPQIAEEKPKTLQSHEEAPQTASPKKEQLTAAKSHDIKLDESQNGKIRNFIFSLFKQQKLRGHFKVENFESLEVIEVILFHKINQYNIQETLRLTFSKLYPLQPPQVLIHSCNLSLNQPEYVIPSFLAFHQLLTPQKWNQQVFLADVVTGIFENINDFHKSEVQRLLSPKKSEDEAQSVQFLQNFDLKQEEGSGQRVKKQRRKNSNMTGCADKELTQTKNLNRHFRSKLRQVLRDLAPNPQDQTEDSKFIDEIFTPNRVGFEDIRKALYNRWFNEGVRRQMNSGQFLHKILRGMMGIKSKKLMIKYYHVMVSAVEEPSSFIRWKYD